MAACAYLRKFWPKLAFVTVAPRQLPLDVINSLSCRQTFAREVIRTSRPAARPVIHPQDYRPPCRVCPVWWKSSQLCGDELNTRPFSHIVLPDVRNHCDGAAFVTGLILVGHGLRGVAERGALVKSCSRRHPASQLPSSCSLTSMHRSRPHDVGLTESAAFRLHRCNL